MEGVTVIACEPSQALEADKDDVEQGIDVTMCQSDPMRVCSELRRLYGAPTLALSMVKPSHSLMNEIKAYANGVVSAFELDEIVKGVNALKVGHDYFPRDQRLNGLTPKQIEATGLYQKGLSIDKIAELMGRSHNTVRKHIEKAKDHFNLEKLSDLRIFEIKL